MSQFEYLTVETAEGEAKVLLQGIEKSYGFVPNLFGYMAAAPTTIKAYLALNELLEETSFSAAQLQVALLAVSVENDCNFCREAHKVMAAKFKSNPQSVAAILSGEVIEDPQDKAIVEMVVSAVKHRGWVPQGDLQAFINAGFSTAHYMELMLVVTIKTLSNYINHQTQPEPNPEFLS